GIFGSQGSFPRGPGRLYAEVQRHYRREQTAAHRAWLAAAARHRLRPLATNGVLYATAAERPIADLFASLRHHTLLDEAGRRLEANDERRLKSPDEMARLFADLPQALAANEEVAARLAFSLEDLGYEFPRAEVPAGETETSHLRRLAERGLAARYRRASNDLRARARRQLERELELIARLRLEGYFLIVEEIVRYCREQGILAQGRGSAANSVACYALGITAVDPVAMDLLFERFLSEERSEWPDIDLDLPSGERRERVIQHVYGKYGAAGAAMTANVITYRQRSAAREVGKALGLPPELTEENARLAAGGGLGDANLAAHPRQAVFLQLCRAIQDLPRHLGQHSGGMVICRGRLDQVVPLENAAMPGRVVIQWDKEDCADLGIIKIDLLGLGMMAALQDAVAELDRRDPDAAPPLDLSRFPADDAATYAMLRAADTVGVFQVESRAQMATLPRLRPEHFYDLVVEVALIRPGPITGEMVNPYLQRRAGRAPVTYPHPCLEPVLRRTLGVPLFQEQLLRMAMAVGGFTGGEAEELRRTLGSHRSEARMRTVIAKLRARMAERGIEGAAEEEIARSITSFAQYGFPESHAASFALLVYASAYLKAHHPEIFYAALLNNQPMGFYHPATLVKDAQRHGVRVLPVCVHGSGALCEPLAATPVGETPAPRPSLRLGLNYVRGLRANLMEMLLAARPFASVDDLARRVPLHKDELRQLAAMGALADLGSTRRPALWQVERAARPAGPLYDGAAPDGAEASAASPLPEMTAEERLAADYAGAGVTLGPHPLALRRAALAAAGVRTARQLAATADGRRVRIAGMVIARQRPEMAKGMVFLSLEDETGIANAIIPPPLFEAHRLLCVSAPLLGIEGILQKRDGVIHVRAQGFWALEGGGAPGSHDFR
ncbi:MAG: error-prone DNA polymerase, partial [Terriglobales bacterium]